MRRGHVGFMSQLLCLTGRAFRVLGSRGHPYLEVRNLEIRQAFEPKPEHLCRTEGHIYLSKITYTDIYRNRKNYIKLINK